MMLYLASTLFGTPGKPICSYTSNNLLLGIMYRCLQPDQKIISYLLCSGIGMFLNRTLYTRIGGGLACQHPEPEMGAYMLHKFHSLSEI